MMEQLSAELPMSSQSFASAFTYAKRNAYCALPCIAAGDDDDANLAEGNTAAISAKEKYGTTAKDVIEHETVYDAGKAVRRVKHLAPQVTAEIIPGAGHDLTLAQADLVNRRILEFVKQNAAAPKTSGTHAA